MNLVLKRVKLKNILKEKEKEKEKEKDNVCKQENNNNEEHSSDQDKEEKDKDKNKILNSESFMLKKENKLKKIIPENKKKEIEKNNKVENKLEINIQRKSLNNEDKNNLDLQKIKNFSHYKLTSKSSIIKINNKWEKIKINIREILDNFFFILFMMIITLVILFIGDIQVILIDPSWDYVIDMIKLMIFIIYILEILFTCICSDGYIYSFFFWLDVLSTIYILQDISFILNPLLGITENM
jgi:hypothetical protein